MSENLKKRKLEELKSRKFVGVQKKYAPLLLNVIESNNNFPVELSDCIIDHNMLETIMLEFDYQFLIHEFGKHITEFPEEFQRAIIVLHEEFQKDFHKASIIDSSIKNYVYGKNYRSPLQYFYLQPEFKEVKSQLRALMLEFTNELGIVANVQPYKVFASCLNSEGKFKLRLEIYVREKNNFPHVLESNSFSKPVDQVDLKVIEQYYEWLGSAQKWGNEIDYSDISEMVEEIQKIIPDFADEYPLYKIISTPNRYGKLIYSEQS